MTNDNTNYIILTLIEGDKPEVWSNSYPTLDAACAAVQAEHDSYKDERGEYDWVLEWDVCLVRPNGYGVYAPCPEGMTGPSYAIHPVTVEAKPAQFAVTWTLYDGSGADVWPGLFPSMEAAQAEVLASCRGLADDETLELDWELDGAGCVADFADQAEYSIAPVR